MKIIIPTKAFILKQIHRMPQITKTIFFATERYDRHLIITNLQKQETKQGIRKYDKREKDTNKKRTS